MCEELRTLRRWANTLIRSPFALCFGLLMNHGWIALTALEHLVRSVGVLAGPHISVRVYVPLLEINHECFCCNLGLAVRALDKRIKAYPLSQPRPVISRMTTRCAALGKLIKPTG